MSSHDKSLLDLYKLLWEQIKDRNYIVTLTGITSQMEIDGIISREEENLLDENIILLYRGSDNTQK